VSAGPHPNLVEDRRDQIAILRVIGKTDSARSHERWCKRCDDTLRGWRMIPRSGC
jgi:hypothetical protein